MAELYFRVHRTELLAALGAVSGAIPRKDEIPILQNVLLQPDGERLIVRGTNLDLEVETRCDLLEAGNGDALTIGFKELFDIAKNMPETAEIAIHEGKAQGQVTISSGRSRYNLHVLPALDFPSMGKQRPPLAFSIVGTVLNAAFKKTLYAVNTTTKDRPHLSGTYIHALPDGKLAVVGCNGIKIAVARINPTEMVDFEPPIIAIDTVKSFSKLMGEAKNECQVFISENKIVFESGDTIIVSKLIDGVFPNYERIIPERHDIKVHADRDAVLRAINRVMAIAGDTKSQATKFLMSRGQMQIEYATTNGQTAVEALDIQYDGEDFYRGFNGALVKDTLESISSSSFLMFGDDPESAGHFTPANDADEDYILMPMRVKS
ncbi:DNA polymerase-3 subunit beta [Rhizobium skierniewicense]|uniref:Beta sliding clamp n=1 Tax=Rhizobium skierniewicense TaxID=984260 RepID=A0A7W6G090_9HYPH|nr:DNA polymerase III subunit beta [Rhizobium skierniewicense]MBB3944673.1 DNA polymerase-3 subunit beta [Rhizobium skierniewicense]